MSGSHEAMNLRQRFSQSLEAGLSSFPSFIKSSHAVDGEEVISYYWRGKLIIDVLDSECCFTATGKNIVYEYCDSDYNLIVGEIMDEMNVVFN
jgi:hypothetical protein